MQNQSSLSNFMSSFEFISILMSIVIGLGVTNLLAGAARAFYRRNRTPIDEVHIVLTAGTLLLLVIQWWVTFKWNTETHWSFERYLALIIWAVSMYLMTVFLYPPDLSEEEEHEARFERNRSGYYSSFVAMCLLDIVQAAIHGDLFHPVWYLPYAGHYALLAGGGLCLRRRGYDRFFAWYLLASLLIWSLLVRRYLVGDVNST